MRGVLGLVRQPDYAGGVVAGHWRVEDARKAYVPATTYDAATPLRGFASPQRTVVLEPSP
jgi:hypothetical protein